MARATSLPAIPRDVAEELARYPDLSLDNRQAILTSADDLGPFSSLARVAEATGLSRRSVTRRLAADGGGFKYGSDQRSAVRVPRALVVRWLCEAAQ